jgi:hypothetical protein
MKTLIEKALIGTVLIAFCWFIHSLYGWIGVGIFFGIIVGLPFFLPFFFIPMGILLAIIYAKIVDKESKDFRTQI